MSAFDSSQNTNTSGTTNSTTNPWAPQAASLTQAFDDAQKAYGTASSAVAPTDYTAQFNPAQLATFQTMINQGADTTAATNAATAGGALTTAGTSGATGALTGYAGYNPASTNNTGSLIDSANQYVAGQNIDAQVNDAMLNANQTARDVTMPGIEQNAANTGNTNSSRTGIADGLVQRGLAEQSANLGASLRSTAFQNGLTLAQQQAQNNNTATLTALQGQGALGTASVNSGVNAGTQSIADNTAQDALASAGGAGMTAAQQANLTNQLQQYQAAIADPYSNLAQLMQVIGSQSWGSSTTGSTTGTSDTTKSPSLISDIGSTIGALNSL